MISDAAARARDRFDERFGPVAPTVIARAPGRANIIGEHTDYNDGLVLPFAISSVTAVALRPTDRPRVRIFAEAFDEPHEVGLPLGRPTATGRWTDYVEGVLLEYAADRGLPSGFDAAIASDVPLRSGLSSSASLEVALALGLQEAFGWPIDDIDIARRCQHAEVHHVGTLCGIMDQAASLLARADHAICLDTRTLSVRYIPIDLPGMAWLVIQSGVQRALASSDYNRRREECEHAVAWLRAHGNRPIDALRDVTLEDLAAAESTMPPALHRRARHVVTENGRVLEMVEALMPSDVARVGDLLSIAHASYRDDFEASIPEADFLVDWARDHGAVGARLTGGGFGGATLHLVPEDQAAPFARDIAIAYRRAFGREAVVFETAPGPGARQLREEGHA